MSEECSTVLLTCCATGRKEKLWLIGIANGQTASPKYSSDLQKYCIFRHSIKALAITIISIEYLNWLNNKMLIQWWKILLFIHNYSSHTQVTLSSVTVKSLSKNKLSRLQPLNQGHHSPCEEDLHSIHDGRVNNSHESIRQYYRAGNLWCSLKHPSCL